MDGLPHRCTAEAIDSWEPEVNGEQLGSKSAVEQYEMLTTKELALRLRMPGGGSGHSDLNFDRLSQHGRIGSHPLRYRPGAPRRPGEERGSELPPMGKASAAIPALVSVQLPQTSHASLLTFLETKRQPNIEALVRFGIHRQGEYRCSNGCCCPKNTPSRSL